MKQRETAEQRAARQERLERDVATKAKFGAYNVGSAIKKAKDNGYPGHFFDYIQSAEIEFKNIVRRARRQLNCLHAVIETDEGDFGYDTDWARHGIPSTWEMIRWSTGHQSLGNGILLGVAHAFRDAGNIRCVILIRKTNRVFNELEEYQYLFKMGLLLHEIGHVHDIANQINFNITSDPVTVNGLEAEVFAHCYALNECRNQGYVESFDMLWTDLSSHKDGPKANEARLVKERCDISIPRQWFTFDKK